MKHFAEIMGDRRLHLDRSDAVLRADQLSDAWKHIAAMSNVTTKSTLSSVPDMKALCDKVIAGEKLPDQKKRAPCPRRTGHNDDGFALLLSLSGSASGPHDEKPPARGGKRQHAACSTAGDPCGPHDAADDHAPEQPQRKRTRTTKPGASEPSADHHMHEIGDDIIHTDNPQPKAKGRRAAGEPTTAKPRQPRQGTTAASATSDACQRAPKRSCLDESALASLLDEKKWE
jgi:hypothetical protein